MDDNQIKKEIEDMIKEIGISKKTFLSNLPLVKGNGYDYVRVSVKEGGHKPSLKQRYSILKEILKEHRELKLYFKDSLKIKEPRK